MNIERQSYFLKVAYVPDIQLGFGIVSDEMTEESDLEDTFIQFYLAHRPPENVIMLPVEGLAGLGAPVMRSESGGVVYNVNMKNLRVVLGNMQGTTFAVGPGILKWMREQARFTEELAFEIQEIAKDRGLWVVGYVDGCAPAEAV